MPDFREQLQQLLQGRVCLMGLGNVDYGDDGFGVRLAQALAEGELGVLNGSASVKPFGEDSRVGSSVIAGTTPETG